ncbi:MAG: thymidine phosphorylase [bacterium]
MRVYDIIYKKRNGEILTQDEINFLIYHYVSEDIPDYQMAAFLMAVYFKGMDKDETRFLTSAMMSSGDTIGLTSVPGIKLDKHSTGGVGDGITLVLAPMVAACAVAVPMMVGRGLGHTGGTADKLESIPGLRTDINKEAFVKQVRELGIVIAAQTKEIAPADRLLYALRDMTATVESIPLIASSIMSKKLACGANALVLDVKCGSGAFMKKQEDARKLAKSMVEIAREMRHTATAFVTNMAQPLGKVIGNANEMAQAIKLISGEIKFSDDAYPHDFMELTFALGEEMLILAKKASTQEEAREKLQATIDNASAVGKMRAMIIAQGGNSAVMDDPDSMLPAASQHTDILHEGEQGFVTSIDARGIGIASMLLGAGRERKDEEIDYGAGIELDLKLGDLVMPGDKIATLKFNQTRNLEAAKDALVAAYNITNTRPQEEKLVLEIIR